ncbi:hypothetical protein HK104_007790 [Borealophlyctis nickersoniae]|nr:hypothetical protein HK104_007790 [Borealophlyctis nickersoniae]
MTIFHPYNPTGSIPMQRNPSEPDEYFATVTLDRSEKCQFKFVVDGVWRCSADFPTETDASGNVNNCLPPLPALPTRTLSNGSGKGLEKKKSFTQTYTLSLLTTNFFHPLPDLTDTLFSPATPSGYSSAWSSASPSPAQSPFRLPSPELDMREYFCGVSDCEDEDEEMGDVDRRGVRV